MQGGGNTQIRGAHAPLGCLEIGGGWCFDALHVAGVENTIADGISPWNPEAIDDNVHAFQPDVELHRQVLGTADVVICSGVLETIHQSVAPSSHRAYKLSFRSWTAFSGLIGEAKYFYTAVSDADEVQALLKFVAWCASEGNQAGTIARKRSAVLHFHCVNLQMEFPTSSSLIKRALKGVGRSHIVAGTLKRVRRPIPRDALLV